jgi:zinc transporter, ZIP family
VAEAFTWGAFASTSLIVGGVIALRVRVSNLVLGLVMAFGAGVLISAVAYELVGEAFDTSQGSGGVALGLFAGCAAFSVGDLLIDRLGGAQRKRSGGEQAEGSPLAIVLGIVLDGIPESIVIGLSLLTGDGVSVAVLAAVFLSNLPEAVAATTGLSKAGWMRSRILWLWVLVTVVAGLSSLAGFALLEDASASTVAFMLAFRGRGRVDDARRHDDARGSTVEGSSVCSRPLVLRSRSRSAPSNDHLRASFSLHPAGTMRVPCLPLDHVAWPGRGARPR